MAQKERKYKGSKSLGSLEVDCEAEEQSYGNIFKLEAVGGMTVATSLPTHSDAGVLIGEIEPGRLVAAYQGAFYSEDYWRPSSSCRMRNYDPGGFCPVCSRIILGLYGMN